ncbi:hypothetical protein RJ640_004166 [Escallonia rubra]|uniref:Sm domain-containing protein n=1 Tax=Escallonia rubra TaxID=112253 RepID=A0AA88U816_9ASTE|nr:hypothetical protein RJ640_004166 [Escallonia rubra]
MYSRFKKHPQRSREFQKLFLRRMLVGISDGRFFLGTFYCLDKQGNIILQDTVEYRSTRRSSPSPMEQRNLGLILIPSSCRISCHVDCSIEEQLSILSLQEHNLSITGVPHSVQPSGHFDPVHQLVGQMLDLTKRVLNFERNGDKRQPQKQKKIVFCVWLKGSCYSRRKKKKKKTTTRGVEVGEVVEVERRWIADHPTPPP